MEKELESLDWVTRDMIFGPMKTKLIFGIGYTKRILGEAKKLNGKRILIMTDTGVEKAGLLDKVKSPLTAEKIDVEVFNQVQSEPTRENLESAIKNARESSCDVIIGVGGGSCLDTAKTASIMTTNNGDITQYIGKDKIKQPGLPLILVPTTAGTGSEVSASIIVSEGHVKKAVISPFVYPDVAVIDPLMTMSMPPRLTAGTAFDALSHGIGDLMSLWANPMTDALALKAVELIAKSLRIAYYNPTDLKARCNLAFAATLAGLPIAITKVTLDHSICYTLGDHGIPHHIGVALALPYVMEYNLSLCVEKLGAVATAMEEEVECLNKYEAALKAVNAVVKLRRDVELPESLKELGIPKEDLPSLARELVTIPEYARPNNPRKTTEDTALKLYEKMWEGNTAQ